MPSRAVPTTALAHGLRPLPYDFGGDHPMTPVRYRLAVELIRSSGPLDRPDVHELEPGPATLEEIHRAHPEAYTRAIRRYSDNPVLGLSWEAAQWGLTPGGDTPAVAELHARVYNDPAVAIHGLLAAGVERVAFVDIDAHHSDGTGSIFLRRSACARQLDPRGRPLPLPGQRPRRRAGRRRGRGRHAERPAARLRRRRALPARDRGGRRPGGAGAPPRGARRGAGLGRPPRRRPHPSADHDGGLPPRRGHDGRARGRGHRWAFAAIGGGGYTGDVLARGTALFFAEMLGEELDDELPAGWRDLARELTGAEPSRRLRGDGGPEAPADARAEADRRAHPVIDEARTLVR